MSATILLVDDDADMQETLQGVILGADYSVAVASNGKEALTALSPERQVDPVLLDRMMPVMHGFPFLAELADDVAHASTPVVAASGAGPALLAGLPPSMPILRKPSGVTERLRTIERGKRTSNMRLEEET